MNGWGFANTCRIQSMNSGGCGKDDSSGQASTPRDINSADTCSYQKKRRGIKRADTAINCYFRDDHLCQIVVDEGTVRPQSVFFKADGVNEVFPLNILKEQT